MLAADAPAPAGFVLIGTTDVQVRALSGRSNDKITLKVYRKN